MKVPVQWLRAYTDIPCATDEYINRMVMIGNGVEDSHELGSEISGVVVGRVLTCEPHPDSDHLHVTTVDVGDGAPLQIVCGAPNCEAGILVPVATIGARLPGGTKIKKGKLRGVESFGMLCAADELGVPQELYPSVGSAGLLIFNEDYPVGSDVKPILGLDDTVIDFEVLANRPDCLSVWGLARESAAACGTVFRKPDIRFSETGEDLKKDVSVEVRASDICPRYIARVVRNLRVGPSPMWLRKYLFGAGMRSINNVVDITNFVMLETGHPMHAFDLDKVEGRRIIVRRAEHGESITTLDGKAHVLSGGELVICDSEKPSCLAGIMGGEESEITAGTRTLMFECAVFDRASVRVTGRTQGIRTESSGRFEKGVSVLTAREAMDRACQLINELDAGDVAAGVIDIYPDPVSQPVITASCARISGRTGVDIPPEKIEEILRSLSFDVKRDGDSLTVIPPDFRQDVDGEADLSEEALRVYGYDRIPDTLLRGETESGGSSAARRQFDRTSALLTGQGFSEIMTFSFISPKEADRLGLAPDDPRRRMVEIRNPLGEETSVMRTMLLPGMLSVLSLNMNRGNESARLFEIARVYDAGRRTDEGLPEETLKLCLGMYGRNADFFSLRSVAELLLDREGIETVCERSCEVYLHPGRQAVLKSGGETVCVLGEVHPAVRDGYELPERAYVAELDMRQIMRLRVPMGSVKPLPRYPAVNRDLSLVMPEDVQAGPLMEAMREAAGPLLERTEMFDVYRSSALGEKLKSIAFSFVFRNADRTLTDDETASAVERILKAAQAFKAELRK